MSPEEKAKVASMLSVRAEITGKTLSTAAIVQMVEDMSDLDFVAVIQSLSAWGRTENGFPYPADIREKIKPELTGDDDAQYVSNMIINAVGRDGYTNRQRAMERIGELGWAVVEASGGWLHLCETLNERNETTVKAQLRELCKTVYKRAKSGYMDYKPSLPTPHPNKNVEHNTRMNLLADQAELIKSQDAASLISSTMNKFGGVK